MKILAQIFLVGCLLAPAVRAIGSPISSPVSSKEEIEFVSRESNKLLALNKIDDFIGVIFRTKISENPNKQIDAYHFKNLTALKSDPKLCAIIADRIFGRENEITLKRKDAKVIPSQSAGKVCTLVMVDPDAQAMIKERHLLAKVLHAKVYAFVFRFPKAPKPEEVQDAYNFIDGLR